MKAKKISLFILLIAAVVFVSGCAQADLVKTSLQKAEALEKGAGYSSDYTLSFSISLNKEFKDFLSKDPKNLGRVSALEGQKFDMLFSEAAGNNGNDKKTVLDLSNFLSIISSASPTANVPQKIILSQYKSGSDITSCFEFDDEYMKKAGLVKNIGDLPTPTCIKGDEKELSKLGLGTFVQSFGQYSSNSPSAVIGPLQTLYNKGLLSVGDIKDDSIINRPCKSVRFTIPDMTKISDQDLIDLMAGLSEDANSLKSQNLPASQISAVLKTILKEFSEELCFDTESGMPLKISAVVTSDFTAVIKSSLEQARAIVPSDKMAELEAKIKEIPANMKMTTTVSAGATSFKTPGSPSDYTLPAGTQAMTAEEAMSKMAIAVYPESV